MIGAFHDQDLDGFYYEGPGRRTRRIPPDIRAAVLRKLDMLRVAEGLSDLRVPPANHLEALAGRWSGHHSIRVNDQWRLVFRWDSGAAYDIRLTDYH